MQRTSQRIASIDILRGFVMIIMALDHTRDYFHATAMTANPLDPETTTIPLFFTRWITHFCAPVFVLLSGMSAFLSSQNKDPREAGNFLIKRGLWLVLLEFTLITFALTFNPFFNFIILQVIWAIGCSMILLGIVSRFSYKAVLVIGILLVVGHNALDYAKPPGEGLSGNLINLLFNARGTIIPLNASHVIGAFYAIMPWTGIMFIGYAMGKWFTQNTRAARRKQLLLISGGSMILIFIVSRALKNYGDPAIWDNGAHPFLSFINTSKYPPSLQYTCMTLGPALIIVAFTENIQAGWKNIVSTYGKVPLFYFVAHFYLLHFLLMIVFFASGHHTSQIIDPRVPYFFRPADFGYRLPVVYAIWLSVVVALYLPCKWFSRYKATHSNWWLKYL